MVDRCFMHFCTHKLNTKSIMLLGKQTTLFGMLLVVLFGLLTGCMAQTSCDYELMLVSSAMGNFNTRGYNPPILNRLFNELNSLQATVLATYQLCFNRIIIDPSSLYPQDRSECLMGLYNVSLLEAKYTGQYSKIKADIDAIAKIVFSTENDCNPIINYRGWSNISDDCKSGIKDLDKIFVDYGNEIILGGTGVKYLNDMLLSAEKLRKLCGFNILTKAKHWGAETCKGANQQWLYPITDQMDDSIQVGNYTNFTASFYNFYQSVYRAHDLCNGTHLLQYE